MNLFKKMTVGKRLFLGFILMILFIAGTGLVGYFSSSLVGGNLDDIFQKRLPSLNYLLQADRDLQQLLVAERSMISADPKSSLFADLKKEYQTNLEQCSERLGKLKSLLESSKARELLAGYDQANQKWQALSGQVLDQVSAGDKQAAMRSSLGPTRQAFENMRDYLDKIEDIILQGAEKSHHKAKSQEQTGLLWISVIGGVGLFIAIALAWMLGGGVSRQLRLIIDNLEQNAQAVNAASGQVSAASQGLAQGASEQAASLEETSSSLEEMSSMTKQNADNAGQADHLMADTKQVVVKANQSMGHLKSAMDKITEASDETAKIIKTIDEIAFQTNLLALNAAVEAARAGEAGAGFAVVADEVRNLAMRAAEAAKNTAVLIEENLQNIRQGSELVQSTDEAFNEVASGAGKVAELVGEISQASQEQAQGIDQLNQASSEMDRVTQKNAATAEESAAAAAELNGRAGALLENVEELRGLVSKTGTPAKSYGTGGKKAPIPPRGQLPAPAAKPANTTRRAEELIPLESDDFGDF